MKRRISKPECMLTETSQTDMKHKEKKEGKKEGEQNIKELQYCIIIKDKKGHNENTINGRKNEKKRKKKQLKH